MSLNKIEKIDWNEIKNELIDFLDPTVYSILDQLSSHLNNDSLDYIYTIKYKYGLNIYKNGKFELSNFEDNNMLKIFKNDIKYNSNDPLGIVIENYIEVYEKEEFQDKNDTKNMYFPINRISKGQFFGTFGFSDYLVKRVDSYSYTWNISSGSRSILCILPNFSRQFPNRSKEELANILCLKDHTDRSAFLQNDYLLLKHVYENCLRKEWNSRILVFPKQWITDYNHFSKDFHFFILKNAWIQSIYSRNKLLSHVGYNDFINLSGEDRLTFYPVLEYVKNIRKGLTYVLKKVKDSEDEIIEDVQRYLVEKFNDFNKQTDRKKYPIILKFELLKESNDWGIFSLSIPQFYGHISKNKSSENIQKMIAILKKDTTLNIEDNNLYMGYNQKIIKETTNYSIEKEETNHLDKLFEIPNGKQISLKKIPFFKTFIIIKK